MYGSVCIANLPQVAEKFFVIRKEGNNLGERGTKESVKENNSQIVNAETIAAISAAVVMMSETDDDTMYKIVSLKPMHKYIWRYSGRPVY